MTRRQLFPLCALGGLGFLTAALCPTPQAPPTSTPNPKYSPKPTSLAAIPPKTISPKGKLFLMGGGVSGETLLEVSTRVGKKVDTVSADEADPKKVFRRLIEISGKKAGEVKIVVITSASVDAVINGDYYKEVLPYLGVKKDNVKIIDLVEENKHMANHGRIVGRLKGANIIHIAGGDQTRLINIVGGSAVHRELFRMFFNEDVLIGGSSAGCASVAATSIRGGDLNDVVEKLKPGLDFIQFVIPETHMARDPERHGRGATVLAATQNENDFVLGFYDGGAGIISPDGRVEIFGHIGALVIVDNPKHLNVPGGGQIKIDPAKRVDISSLPECETFANSGFTAYRLMPGDVFYLPPQVLEKPHPIEKYFDTQLQARLR